VKRSKRAFPVVVPEHQYINSPSIVGTLRTFVEAQYGGHWVFEYDRKPDLRRSHQRRVPWRLTED
jgi:hypothetical protein